MKNSKKYGAAIAVVCGIVVAVYIIIELGFYAFLFALPLIGLFVGIIISSSSKRNERKIINRKLTKKIEKAKYDSTVKEAKVNVEAIPKQTSIF